MRRALVLTEESARHPFLASLPAHIRKGVEPVSPRTDWTLTKDDVRGFVSVYFAVFVCALAFII